MNEKRPSLQGCLRRIPLFWKIFWSIVGFFMLVVGLAEFILEPVADEVLTGLYGGFQPWHEAVIWLFSILVPATTCGYVLSKILSAKLLGMSKAAETLARGNLEIHLPTTGNDTDPFDTLARSFNDMALSVKKQRQYGRRLLADISHELRSPLTRMSVTVGLLSRRHDETEQQTLLHRLERELERMNELVSTLLMRGSEDGKSSGMMEEVDIGALLAALADDFSFQGKAQNKEVLVDESEHLQVYGNQILLQRMFGNLLANAVFYTPENSKVRVDARKNGEDIVVAIRDFGPGVPEDQLEEIFRAFYRVDSSRARASGGVGLGLALAREAAIHHGGNIVADNVVPGLRVTVTLPLHAPEFGCPKN